MSTPSLHSLRVKEEEGATFRFENCKYVVKVKARGEESKPFPKMVDRVLIQGCSAAIAPGEV